MKLILIRVSNNFEGVSTFTQLYNSLVHSSLDYAVCIWNPYYEKYPCKEPWGCSKEIFKVADIGNFREVTYFMTNSLYNIICFISNWDVSNQKACFNLVCVIINMNAFVLIEKFCYRLSIKGLFAFVKHTRSLPQQNGRLVGVSK